MHPIHPISLSDYERALDDTLTDTTLSAEARAAKLRLLARDVRRAVWRDPAAGRQLAERIEASIDQSVDVLSGLGELASAGLIHTVDR